MPALPHADTNKGDHNGEHTLPLHMACVPHDTHCADLIAQGAPQLVTPDYDKCVQRHTQKETERKGCAGHATNTTMWLRNGM